IATRTKWTYLLTRRDSASVAKGFVKLFNSQICPIIWSKVKVLMVDRGVEFQGNIIILMNEHGIQIQLANSKESIGIIERFNRTLQE
ncbi:14357_t:CDS:1, partial [Funneliformis geosporum]